MSEERPVLLKYGKHFNKVIVARPTFGCLSAFLLVHGNTRKPPPKEVAICQLLLFQVQTEYRRTDKHLGKLTHYIIKYFHV